MKKLILTLFAALITIVSSYAQSVSGQISMCPIITDDGLANESTQILTNKLSKILAENGCGTVSNPDRFIISASVDLISNTVTPTNPPKVSKQLEVTLIIGDFVENKTFASLSVTLNGIGISDVKAEIAALNKLSSSQNGIKSMIEKAKQEIIAYYGSNSARFLANAKGIALKGNYDEAISYLMSVPPVNDLCFAECQDYAVKLYQEKLDNEGYSLYFSAKAEWTTDKSTSGAYKASQNLKKISPLSKCYPDALALWNQISDILDAEERAAKEFAQKQYNDNLEMRISQMENNQAFKMAIIDACKAVGTAFGEHAPQNVTKIVKGWH